MIELIGNRVAITPIYDPDTVDRFSPALSQRELAHMGIHERDLKPSRIIVPDEAKERCDQGIVKYVGPKVTTLKVGDYVIFSGYVGTLVYLDGEGKMIIMPEKFVQLIALEKNVEVPGLFFQGVDGDYFPATYEYAMEIIARAFTSADRTIAITSKKPSPEEYNELTAGAGTD